MNRFCKTAFLIFGLALLAALQGAAGGMALAQSPDPFADKALTCEEMRRYPEKIFSGSIDLGSGAGSPVEVDYGCKESLGELPFLRRLASLAGAIRGVQRWPCQGTQVYASARYYGFYLLKAGLAPSLFLRDAEAAAEPRRGADDKLRHFAAWSLQSFSNFRLHQAFLSEYDRALPALAEHYRRKFRFPEAKARAVARHALGIFTDRAFGAFPSREESETPSLVKLSMDSKSTVADLRTALAVTPSPGQEQIDQALKIALLYGKPRPYLSLLIDKLETLNAGDESAIVFALGDPENVKLLLERGADADHANDFGKTPLFYAIELGQSQLVELLLDHGADVNHAYKSAAQLQLPLGEELSANAAARLDANPCAYDIGRSKRTPLMHAAQHGGVRMLALLVKRGARLGDVDDQGSNALDYAILDHRRANADFLRSLGLRPH